jgi:hypothetical protein
MLAHSSHMLTLGVALTIIGLASPTYADEVWRCAYTDTNSLANANFLQVLAQYHLEGHDLVQKMPSGVTKHFKIIQNNRYGLIAISASAGAPQNNLPSVSATTVVIEKSSGDFWLTTTIGGEPGTLNQPIHGRCFKP